MSNVMFLPGEDYTKVKNGEETLFLTTFDNRLPVGVNDFIPVVFERIDDSALVQIVDFGYKNFGDLTLDDAQSHGFQELDALKKYLVERFVTLDNASRLYYYRYELAGISEKINE